METDWRVNTIQGDSPTYQQFMALLTGLDSILIRAKYTNVSHKVNCDNIMLILLKGFTKNIIIYYIFYQIHYIVMYGTIVFIYGKTWNAEWNKKL